MKNNNGRVGRKNIIETLKQIEPGFEVDVQGNGFGVHSSDHSFVRIKPFWISKKELEEKL